MQKLSFKIIIFGILIAVPILLYWQTTGFELVWDDLGVHLLQNPYLNPPTAKSLFHLWTEPYRHFYIPAAYTIWALIQNIGSYFSMALHSPFLYHLANIIFHTLNSVLVFFLIQMFIKNRTAALAGALFFAAHPIQVESVAWASELRGLTAASFGLTSLYIYLKGAKSGKSRLLPISWILFVIALLCKPSSSVMPIFAFIMDRYSESWKKRIIKIVPWIVPVLIIFIITWNVQVKEESFFTAPLWARPLIWMYSIMFYLYKLAVPLSLGASYALSPIYLMAQWQFYFIWIIPCAVAALIIRTRKKEFIVPAALFVAGFLPVSGLVSFIFQSWSTTADRYLYWSMIGLSLGIAFLWANTNRKLVHIGVGTALLFISLLTAFVQIPVWKDRLSLWTHCIKVTPNESRAYNNRGFIYSKQRDYKKSLADFNKSIALNPSFSDAYNNRGNLYRTLKNYRAAIVDYTKAIKIKPKGYLLFYNRGVTYSQIGRFNKALKDFSRALELNPKYINIYISRANLYAKIKNYAQAQADYKKAISINRNSAKIYNNRGSYYHDRGDYKNAIADYNLAISLNLKYAKAYNNRANTYASINDYKKAISDYTRSIYLDPGWGPAYINRGIIYFYTQDYSKARADIKKALSLGLKVNPALLKDLGLNNSK